MRIQLSEEERKNGRLDPDKLAFATALLRANGAVIIEDVLGADRTEQINAAFFRILAEVEAGYEYGDGVFNAKGQTKNLRLDLPFEAPFIDADVVENPFFLDIAEQILGEDLTLRYLASNNSMPGGTKKQPVHSDTGPLIPETKGFQSPIHSLVLHIPMCNFTEENGATEFYPGGTHLNPDHVFSNPKLIQQLGEVMHYEKAIMPKGGLGTRRAGECRSRRMLTTRCRSACGNCSAWRTSRRPMSRWTTCGACTIFGDNAGRADSPVVAETSYSSGEKGSYSRPLRLQCIVAA